MRSLTVIFLMLLTSASLAFGQVPKPEANKAGDVRKNPIGLEMVWIPPGEFMMGSTPKEAEEAFNDCKKFWGGLCNREVFMSETPKHKVTFKEGFWMGKFEVTQGQWQAMMGNNPSYFKDCGSNCPVEKVSWDDIQGFLKTINARNDGLVYSLPSEAEWEYACRAGTTTKFTFGDSLNSEQANWDKGKDIAKTVPVGSYQPNAWGLYDVHGNVKEWCQDIYNKDGYGRLPVDGSANQSLGDTKFRMIRGGGWRFFAYDPRSALRLRDMPDDRDFSIGFRVVARSK